VRDPRPSGNQRPTPLRHSRQLGEPIDDVHCQRGHFVLIRTAGGRGWVASTDIRTTAFRRDGHNLVAAATPSPVHDPRPHSQPAELG
jgi:hypothetical protein